MKRAAPAWILLVGVGVAFAGVLHRNHLLAERQVATLQRQERLEGELRRLLKERAALQARHPSATELAGLVADGTEARALRTHIAELERTRAGRLGAPGEPFGDSTPVTAACWTYAGQATPRAALMSVLWTASHGDVDRLAELIEFSGAARTDAEAFFGQLPLASQQEYGSPERVVATLLAGNFPKNAAAATYEGGGGNAQTAYAALTIDHAEGESRTNVYAFNLTDSGWRLQVPREVLAGYERVLQAEPASSGGPTKP